MLLIKFFYIIILIISFFIIIKLNFDLILDKLMYLYITN